MNYAETLDYLYQRLPMFQKVGEVAFKKGLGNIIALCEELGNPQSTYSSIHIGGTNGKGSVSNLTASVLQEAGYKVGLYTSPHLRNFTERIRVNGQEMPEEAVCSFVERMREPIERISPSFFEVTVVMAFDHFRNEKVDYAVIEVGLGGRLDSTNIILPIAGAITNISFDHQAVLGDTLALIAVEKAGIFKKDIPFVIGEFDEETRPVFEKIAHENGAKVKFCSDFISIGSSKEYIDYQDIELVFDGEKVNTYRLGLKGGFQALNLRTVLGLVGELRNVGVEIPEDALERGLENVKTNTGFRGRMTMLSKKPLVLADVGHNEAGVREVLKEIAKVPHEQLHMVWGMVKDKDIEKILGMLPSTAKYYFVCPDVPRGLDADILRKTASTHQLQGGSHPSVKAGLEAAIAQAQPQDLVFVGGSTFVVAEVV